MRTDVEHLLRHLAVRGLGYEEVRSAERARRALGRTSIPLSVPARRPPRRPGLRWTVVVAGAAPRSGATTAARLLREALEQARAVAPAIVDLSTARAPLERALAVADELLVVARAHPATVAGVPALEARVARVPGAPAPRWVVAAFDAQEEAQRAALAALRGLVGERLAPVLHRDDAYAAALARPGGDPDPESQLAADGAALAEGILARAAAAAREEPEW